MKKKTATKQNEVANSRESSKTRSVGNKKVQFADVTESTPKSSYSLMIPGDDHVNLSMMYSASLQSQNSEKLYSIMSGGDEKRERTKP